ncbi:ABC transporter substrate-binding protein [Streptococcus pneumoniae]|nr:ABC transporter substrate-binding protein [Streptococcus pneumoniae]VNM74775.1 ABC transporter substrate-binding protein [Streptococcus pneumoniae]VQB87827.1 ABC transporter substrate-binding protein [Streptococcus pneumoniae]VRI31241.1 ABC transporter substrate-binding protein [Streptococcus pneumoniae]
MKFKTFSKSAVLLTASLAVLAACGSKKYSFKSRL